MAATAAGSHGSSDHGCHCTFLFSSSFSVFLLGKNLRVGEMMIMSLILMDGAHSVRFGNLICTKLIR